MPTSVTYPGVYIEELPSGVRTIVGVSTSITAFLGRAARGPVDDPTVVNNFGDFERTFGGLGVDYPMSYSVRSFFLNGGGQAIVVRVYKPEDGGGGGNGGNGGGGEGTVGVAKLDAKGLELAAASPGSWANGIRARIDHDVAKDLSWMEPFGLKKTDLFNLTVRDTRDGSTETFLNLTVKESPRRVDRVLEAESTLIRGPTELEEQIPEAHKPLGAENGDGGDGNGGDGGDGPGNGNGNGGNGNGNGGSNGGPSAATAAAPPPDVWGDNEYSSKVSTEGKDSASLDLAAYEGSRADKTGLYALEDADLFNLLCIPADKRGGSTPNAVYQTAMSYCEERRAVLLVDPPHGWKNAKDAVDKLGDLGLSGVSTRNAALYFPRVKQSDPLLDGIIEAFVPCGVVAGVIARTDATRGVWKAPAGIDAALRGTQGLSVAMTDDENGMINPLGINALRSFPIIGRVSWGARTLRGADQLADEYKYLPVRRLALFIEESLFRGTKWVVFEPNDEPLWAQLRLNVGAFMRNLFRRGAFQGSSPRDAYFVKVDRETTTQNDINLGIVNIVVGFAPLKPAEFVIIKIQQIAGDIET